MTTVLRPAVRIETRHVERAVVLSCDSCVHEVRLSTRDDDFTARLGGFFEGHARCQTWVRLP